MKFLLDKHLSCVHITNGTIIPVATWRAADGGVKDSNGNFVSSSMWIECVDNQTTSTVSNDSLIYESKKRAIFLGYFLVSCYGHVITDNLRKLWFLNTDYCKKLLALGYEIVYMTLANEIVPQYMEELFAFAGCNIKQCRHITKPETFDDVVVPDSCLFHQNGHLLYTQEYVWTIDRIKHSVEERYADVKIKPKIYYTRRCIKNKRVPEYNEQSIENEFIGGGGMKLLHLKPYQLGSAFITL